MLRLLVVLLTFFITSCEMEDQARYDPYQRTKLFGDNASARDPVPNTIAWGSLKTDGVVPSEEDNQWPDRFTKAQIYEGKRSFESFCAPCHGNTGDGNGLVVARGFPAPSDLHAQRQSSLGHLFRVAYFGFKDSPAYRGVISVKESWEIVAFIRALQLSRHASLDDVPIDLRGTLR